MRLSTLIVSLTITLPVYGQIKPNPTPVKFDSLYRKNLIELRREIIKYGYSKTSTQLFIDSTVKKGNWYEVSTWSTPYDSIYGTKLKFDRKSTYDEVGKKISSTEMYLNSVEGLTTKYAYNNFDKIISKREFTFRDELYSTSEYEYDDFSNLILEKYYRPSDSFSYHMHYKYDKSGNLIEKEHIRNVTDPDYEEKETYSYDDQNKMILKRQYLHSKLVQEEYREYRVSDNDSSITTHFTSYYDQYYSSKPDGKESKRRDIEVFFRNGKLKEKASYFSDALSSQSTIKYDSAWKMIEKSEFSKRPINGQCVNDSGWSVTTYLYDSKGQVIKYGCDIDSYFTGTAYVRSDDGKIIERKLFRDGVVDMKEIRTYTYAK